VPMDLRPFGAGNDAGMLPPLANSTRGGICEIAVMLNGEALRDIF
jgi:hypothetical protein